MTARPAAHLAALFAAAPYVAGCAQVPGERRSARGLQKIEHSVAIDAEHHSFDLEPPAGARKKAGDLTAAFEF